MILKVLNTEQEFAKMRHHWDALLGHAVDANNFISFDWLFSWWTAYQPNARLFIVLVEKKPHLLTGIAPLMITREKVKGFTYRKLLLIGDGTHETDHMNFVIHKKYSIETLDCLLEYLFDSDEWDVAQFNQIPQLSDNCKHLIQWIEQKKYKTNITTVACPVHKFKDDFEHLLSGLKPRFRTKIRATRRKLSKEHDIEFGVHNNPITFGQNLEVLFRIHESRWKAKNQSGVFKDKRRRQFYSSLTPAFFGKNWLRFFYLKIDGDIAAQEYCFEYDSTIYLLQEGFDYQYSNLNVGNMLRSMVFEYAIYNDLRAYDFLAGVSQHKKNWSNDIVHDLRIEIVRAGLRNSIYYYHPKFLDLLKTMVNRVVPRPIVVYFKRMLFELKVIR